MTDREGIITDRELDAAGYVHLGWANGWRYAPEEYIGCKHKYPDRESISHNQRGTDNTYMCHKCKWYFKVDSGD